MLYAFAWDEYCSAYLELCKPRLADPATRRQAQSMLLLGLDTILRLLHPIMPFVTEEIWQHLRETVAGRRMPWDAGTLAKSIMVAAWPTPPAAWIDARTETQFGSLGRRLDRHRNPGLRRHVLTGADLSDRSHDAEEAAELRLGAGVDPRRRRRRPGGHHDRLR
ncbi:MAG: class I tRNA ligase family protein, partial [Planctomycetia bacterium]